MLCFGGIGTHLHVYVAPTIPRCFSVYEATLWAWETLDGLNTGQAGGNTCNQSLESILQVLGSRYVYLDQDIPCGEYPISQPILLGKKTWVAVYCGMSGPWCPRQAAPHVWQTVPRETARRGDEVIY